MAQLQADIVRLQRFCSSRNAALDIELGPLSEAFPNGSFPIGAVHEFLTTSKEDVAATHGFVSGILSALMKSSGAVLWISAAQIPFPPALKNLGIEPDRFVFLSLSQEKDVLWAMEEALKCGALKAVVCEVRDLSFTESRRLQLAVEQSQVTGFILRYNVRKINTTACVSRWKITSLASDPIEDLPGVGYPKWKVELLRIRNGKAGSWEIQWKDNHFVPVEALPVITPQRHKTG